MHHVIGMRNALFAKMMEKDFIAALWGEVDKAKKICKSIEKDQGMGLLFRWKGSAIQ